MYFGIICVNFKKRSLIVHGAPRSILFEDIQKVLIQYKPESFARYKGSLVVVFNNREIMGQCVEYFNCALKINNKEFKMVPVVRGTDVKCLGCPKTLPLTDITSKLKEIESDILFCHRSKK